MQENAHFEIAEEFKEEIARQAKRDRILTLAPVGVLLFLILLFSVIAEGFFTIQNIRPVLSQLAIPLVMAMGITFVILIGSIDLSGEGLGGFAGSVVTLMVLNTKNAMDLGMTGVLIAIAAGLAVGFVTGIIHVRGRIPSFMVTYAVSSIMTGLAVLAYKGEPAMVKYALFTTLSKGGFLGIPYLTLIALAVFLFALFLQNFTRFGTYVYAIGDNEKVARNTGINIELVKIQVFAWSGFCIGLAGVLGAIRVGRGEVLIGKDTVFPAITAVVVGGTALSGGKGGVVNSLIGALIVVVISNGLILLGVNPYIQSAVQGLIIATAVALSVSRGSREIVK